MIIFIKQETAQILNSFLGQILTRVAEKVSITCRCYGDFLQFLYHAHPIVDASYTCSNQHWMPFAVFVSEMIGLESTAEEVQRETCLQSRVTWKEGPDLSHGDPPRWQQAEGGNSWVLPGTESAWSSPWRAEPARSSRWRMSEEWAWDHMRHVQPLLTGQYGRTRGIETSRPRPLAARPERKRRQSRMWETGRTNCNNLAPSWSWKPSME